MTAALSSGPVVNGPVPQPPLVRQLASVAMWRVHRYAVDAAVATERLFAATRLAAALAVLQDGVLRRVRVAVRAVRHEAMLDVVVADAERYEMVRVEARGCLATMMEMPRRLLAEGDSVRGAMRSNRVSLVQIRQGNGAVSVAEAAARPDPALSGIAVQHCCEIGEFHVGNVALGGVGRMA